jgi:hypothetical protein
MLCLLRKVFGELMRRVTSVATTILLANVRNHRVRVFCFDFKRGDERIFCGHGDVVDLSLKLKPNGKLHWRLLIGQKRRAASATVDN